MFWLSMCDITACDEHNAIQASNGSDPNARDIRNWDSVDRKRRADLQGQRFADLIDRDPAIARAVTVLVQSGASIGFRSRKLSIRVNPGIMDAAKARFGLANESDVVNASLAMAAAPDRFTEWLLNGQDTLPEECELAV